MEEYSEGHRAPARHRARRRPYAIRVPAGHVISPYGVLGLCAGGGLVAGGLALAVPPLPVFLALFVLIPVVLLLWLFSRRPLVFEVSELGLRFGVGGLTGRLMTRDVWFPGRRRPVIVRWQSIREIVIRSGPATGDSRVTAEIGVLVKDGVKVPRGWREPDSARPTPSDCPYWQRFPPGRVDVPELTAAIGDFGGVRPVELEPTPSPYHLYGADRTTVLGVGIGIVAWAAALFVRLVGGDDLALLAAPLFLLGGAGIGLAGFRRDKRLLSLEDGGLRFGRPIAFVPWGHVQRVVVDGQLPGALTLALRLGPESRLPRLYERNLRGADPVSLATALSVWLPGRIRLIRAQPTVRM
jgi:hypothetical protein